MYSLIIIALKKQLPTIQKKKTQKGKIWILKAKYLDNQACPVQFLVIVSLSIKSEWNISILKEKIYEKLIFMDWIKDNFPVNRF